MPMHTLRKAVLTFVLGLVLVVATTGEALVARPEEIQLSPEDRQQVARIEEYLNRLTTVRARFLQVSSNGQVAEGDFFMAAGPHQGRIRSTGAGADCRQWQFPGLLRPRVGAGQSSSAGQYRRGCVDQGKPLP